MQQRDADQPGPEERRQGALPRPGNQSGDDRGQRHRQRRDHREQLVDELDVAVGQQVGSEPRPVGKVAEEQPTHVCVEQPLGETDERLAESPGRVRVTLAVGERVVPAVVGDPLGRRALQGGAARETERDAQAPLGLERPVRQVAVEARTDAEAADAVEDQAERDVQPVEAPTPGDRHGHHQRGERQDDEGPEGDQHAGALLALGQGLRYVIGGGLGDSAGLKECGGHDTSLDDSPGGRSCSYAYVTVTYGGVGSPGLRRVKSLFGCSYVISGPTWP